MPSRAATDTSVAVSLADLAKIEEERIEQEQAERARLHAQRARDEREAATTRRVEAEAQATARVEEQARRARDEAIARARAEARERAAIDVARIEAEAKLRLEADNAARAHELAELRLRRETGRRRREVVLATALAIFVGLGGVSAYDAKQRHAELERTGEELRDRERAVARERDDARRTDLEALDRRHAKLLARPLARDAEPARQTAEAARAAIDARSPRHDGLRAFAESLDALETRQETLERLTTLEHRHADLVAWANSSRRMSSTDAAKSAASLARAPGADSGALVAYERALDQLGAKLANPSGLSRNSQTGETVTEHRKCQEGDPGCGLDGRPVF